MSKKQVTSEMRDQLRSPFPNEAYQAIESKPYLTTLKAMYVTERLNDVFGLGRWTIEFNIIEKTPENIVLQGEFISFDFDIHVPKQFGGHALNRKGMELADAYKSAVTDCQSKISSYLEIGIDMFKGLIKLPNQQKRPTNTQQNQTTQRKRPANNQQNQTTQRKRPANNQQKKQRKQVLNEKHKDFSKSTQYLINGGTLAELRKRFIIDKRVEKLLSTYIGVDTKVIDIKDNKEILTDTHKDFTKCVEYLAESGSIEELRKRFKIDKLVQKGLENAAADLIFLHWHQEQQKKQG